MTAKDLAKALARNFLAEGAFEFAGTSGASMVPASAGRLVQAVDEFGFTGLRVQSVGYEVGVENPRVHVYLVSGSRKSVVKQIEAPDDAVPPVVLDRIGRVQIRPEAASGAGRGRLFERNGRIACGSSCAPSAAAYAGTVGALVRKTGQPGTLYCLSNNHVFGDGNHSQIGTPIMSPSSLDGRPNVRAPQEIARHSELCELRSGDPEQVGPACSDLAIANVVNKNLVSSWQGDAANGYDTPSKVVAPVSGMRVKKFGRTTGYTVGTIESYSDIPAALPYRCTHFTARVWYRNVWVVRSDDQDEAFALPGDSGSLVVTEDGDSAVGIIFATDPKGARAIMIPMEHAISQFGGLKLVSGHGV